MQTQYTTKEKDMLASVNKCIVALITDTPMGKQEFQKKRKTKVFTSFSDPSSSIPPLTASLSSPTLTSAILPASTQVPSPNLSSSTSASTYMTSAAPTSPRPSSTQVSSPAPAPSPVLIHFTSILFYFTLLYFILLYNSIYIASTIQNTYEKEVSHEWIALKTRFGYFLNLIIRYFIIFIVEYFISDSKSNFPKDPCT
jgi:hypothetical protein